MKKFNTYINEEFLPHRSHNNFWLDEEGDDLKFSWNEIKSKFKSSKRNEINNLDKAIKGNLNNIHSNIESFLNAKVTKLEIYCFKENLEGTFFSYHVSFNVSKRFNLTQLMFELANNSMSFTDSYFEVQKFNKKYIINFENIIY